MATVVRNMQATHDLENDERSTTIITSLGGIDYYLDGSAAVVIFSQLLRPSNAFSNSIEGDLRPCTVVDWSKDHLNKEDLSAISSKYTVHDDVWTPAFLEGENILSDKNSIGNCLQHVSSQ